MITIAYDETNGFEVEENINQNQAAFLGGVIYHDNQEGRYPKNVRGDKIDLERKRIVIYLEEVCEAAGVKFPQGLHGSRTSKLKKEIKQSFPEFFLKGTYKGKQLVFKDETGRLTGDSNNGTNKAVPRRGYYQIIVILKGENLKNEDTEQSALSKDSLASNLYQNMVKEMIIKSVFLNPYFTEASDELRLNIPTRVFKNPKEEDKRKEYRRLGYKQTVYQEPQPNPANQKEKEYYQEQGYRHIIKKDQGIDQWIKDINYWEIVSGTNIRQIVNDYKDIRPISIRSGTYDFFVDPIKYSDKNQADKYAFLYLSDLLCVFLKKDLAIEKDIETYAVKLRRNMNSLNHRKDNMFFYYDLIDNKYNDAAKALLEGNIFDALKNIYEGRYQFKGKVKQYYSRKWFPQLERRILACNSAEQFKLALQKARDLRETNNLSQEKLLYVYCMLQKLAAAVEVDKLTLFRLNDLGITAYTHIGAPQEAIMCYEKCEELSEYADPSEIKTAMNRMITVYNDMFNYETAVKYATNSLGVKEEILPKEDNSNKLTLIKKIGESIRNLLSSEKNKRTVQAAEDDQDENLIDRIAPISKNPASYKPWSSLGQVYSYAQKQEAETCFLRALGVLEEEKEPDYYVTLSYLLHWYIEKKDQDNYEKYAAEFFNGYTDLDEQLRYIVVEGNKQEPKFSFRYAMFVYIKAFYNFYVYDENNLSVLGKLIHLKETIISILGRENWENDMIKGHPWEIIYKYAAILELIAEERQKKKNDNLQNKRTGNNMQLAKKAIAKDRGFTINRILDYGDIEYNMEKLRLKNANTRLERECEKRIIELWNAMVEKGFIAAPKEEIESEKMWQQLSRIFTYMYH